MSEELKTKGVSRRKFIQGLGTGVIGGAVLPHVISAADKSDGQKRPSEHEGKELISLTVNGEPVRLMIEPRTTLAELLRDHLHLTGTKVVCNQGECGGCTVLVDGKAIYSCHILALDVDGKEVTTIEGLLDGEKLHPIQQAFIDHDGYQCGFCTPGQIMAAQALLLKNPQPTKEQVMQGMAGNLCRCSAYPKIVDSVLAATEKKWR